MLNMCLAITSNIVFSQGILEHPEDDIVSYLKKGCPHDISIQGEHIVQAYIFVGQRL
jgi:hypothetical protein